MLLQPISKGQLPISGGYFLLFMVWINGFGWVWLLCSASFSVPGVGERCFSPALSFPLPSPPAKQERKGQRGSRRAGGSRDEGQASTPSQPAFPRCNPCVPFFQETGGSVTCGQELCHPLCSSQLDLALRRKEGSRPHVSWQNLGPFFGCRCSQENGWQRRGKIGQSTSKGIERESQNLIRH